MVERTVIRELVTLLGFEIDEKDLKAFDDRIARVRKNLRRMAIAAGIAAGAITAIAVTTAKAGDNIAKTSRRFGMGVQALQEWRFAAERSGVEVGLLDTAILMLGRNAGEVATFGKGEAAQAFDFLKVSVKNAAGEMKGLDELLSEVTTRLGEQTNEGTRLTNATKIFGRGGGPIVQMVGGGPEALEALRKRFRALRGAMDDVTAKMSEDTLDAWTDLKVSMLGVVYTIGKELMPIIIPMLKSLAEWIAKNHDLVALLAKITIGLIAFTSVAFGAVAVVTLMKVQMLILNTTVGALLLKFLLIPAAILAIAAAIALIVEDINLYFSGAGVRTVTGDLLAALPKFLDAVKKKIKSAINAVWDFMKDVFRWLISLPDKIYAKFSRLFQRLLQAIPAPLRRILEEGAVGIQGAIDAISQTTSPAGGTARTIGAIASGVVPGVGPVINNAITINAAPGQTPGAIAESVASRIGGARLSAGITGLGK